MSALLLLVVAACTSTYASTIAADSVAVDVLVSTAPATLIQSQGPVVVASSVTLQGTLGYLTNESSFTASEFFGDGRGLSGVISLASTQTFTGLNAFFSSVTVQSGGRDILLSTSASTANLRIGGSGAVVFDPLLHNSAVVSLATATTSNTSFGSCVAGSTLTIATAGGRVEIAFTGSLLATGGSLTNAAGLNVLQDGQFLPGLSASRGITYIGFGSGLGTVRTNPFSYLIDAPPTGAHSYCLSLAALGASTSATLTDSAGLGDFAGQRNLYFVQELR